MGISLAHFDIVSGLSRSALSILICSTPRGKFALKTRSSLARMFVNSLLSVRTIKVKQKFLET